nr:DegT/DnrJ/EryC1/StrS family aminotransferase [Desulfococcaceae bacterium HSG9]
MQVPFSDLKTQYNLIASEIKEAIESVVKECAFINGKYVQEFEARFAKFCGAKHCIGVGNGTDALFIALKALNIGVGDEVIVPANSFVATSEAVTLTGAKVVFADCDPQTYNIDVHKIASLMTQRSKAIIPVHLYGQPADMNALQQIAHQHELKIIQDCAQAHGAEIDSKPLASFGDVLCFSFYPGKNLGAYGDAGAIVTNNDEIAHQVRMMANHGREAKYDHVFEGVNSRMDGIQGAILSVKLKYLNQWTHTRRKNAAYYDQLLKDAKGVVTPYVASNVKHVYHLYVIRTKKREELQQHLKTNGIATGIHYPIALPNLTAYRYLKYKQDDFPVASMYQHEVLSLPIYPEQTYSMIEFVCEVLRRYMRK